MVAKSKKIVYKVTDNMDKSDILCTTHQMDDFYVQFNGGQIKESGVMNYIQHLAAALMPGKDSTILDVCCGRSMILPLLQHHSNKIKKYIGLDISKKNLKEARVYANCNFECEWIQANAIRLSNFFKNKKMDFIIYTSALEHMHPNDGIRSLKECFKILKKDGLLFLSTPNTDSGGYNTRYRAHIYEWNYDELRKCLKQIGFKIKNEFGILADDEKKLKKQMFKKYGHEAWKYYQDIKKYIPSIFLTSFMAVPFPKISKEILFLLTK